MSRGHFLPVGDVLVESSLAEVPFACDVERCGGACCTVPGAEGAPLVEGERSLLEEVLPVVMPFLSAEAQEVIRRQGAVLERSGRVFTRCVEEGPCVFVVWERGIARCALQRAYEMGLTRWCKPLSCQLFPLRLRQHGEQRFLVFDPFPECAPAYGNGRRLGVSVLEMVRQGLERAFGEEWYEKASRELSQRARR
ncbi:hypothetical protein HRbin21_00740 [bacterium HR21]|nr:hypothetical protein HRbin21_00740 [bacterium HR21]